MILFDTDAIRRRLFAEIVSRTRVTDFRAGGQAVQFLESWVQRFDEVSDAIWALRDAAMIGSARGDDLDAILADALPDGMLRSTGARGTGGGVEFGRPSSDAMPEIVIAAGFPVLRAGDRTRYVTTADATIAVDAEWSAPVAVIADRTGTSGNCGVGDIVTLGASKQGVTKCRNTISITNGADSEDDDAARDRLRRSIRAVGKAVPSALVQAALAASDPTYGTVRFASLEPVDEALPGIARLWIDNGNGDCEVSVAVGAGEVLVPEAVGGEQYCYLAGRPVKTVPQILVDDAGVPYTIVKPWGQVKLATALAAGEVCTAGAYSSYGGLVAAVQRAIDGEIGNSNDYPGVAAHGVIVYVGAASRVSTTHGDGLCPISANVVRKPGAPATLDADLRTAMVAFTNNRDIGEHLYPASVVNICMSNPWVLNVTDVLIDQSSGAKYCGPNNVIRTIDSLIDFS
jgi:hypothetical protein